MPEIKIGTSLTFATVNDWLDNRVVNTSDDVRVDVSNTQHIDSAGVALILNWVRLCHRRGAKLALTGVSEQLQNLLDVYEVDAIIDNDKA